MTGVWKTNNTYTIPRTKRPETQKNAEKMGILNDLRTRVANVNDGLQTGELVRNTVMRHPEDIMELQKQQLFSGLASNGQDIRPYYSEDLKPSGYFKSAESAKRYVAWKESGITYPYSANRNPDAPNLYINGRFHDELGVEFTDQTVGVVGTTGYAKGIVAKYGIQTFGLMMSNWMVVFVERGAYDELMRDIRTLLYSN